MKKSYLKLIFAVIVIGFLVYIFISQVLPKEKLNYLTIGDTRIKVELAITPEARTWGLSGREPLEENEGLLFVFEEPGEYGFWMKDMKFSLDIIWLDEGGHIVYIEKNVSPESYPKVFRPEKPALYVLEVNAGFSDKYNVKAEDTAKLP